MSIDIDAALKNANITDEERSDSRFIHEVILCAKQHSIGPHRMILLFGAMSKVIAQIEAKHGPESYPAMCKIIKELFAAGMTSDTTDIGQMRPTEEVLK